MPLAFTQEDFLVNNNNNNQNLREGVSTYMCVAIAIVTTIVHLHLKPLKEIEIT